MIIITGPEGSGHHLLQAIYKEHRCHGYFFCSLPSNRRWMDKKVGQMIGKNACVGDFISLEFVSICEPSQILFLHRSPKSCIYSAWKRFGQNNYGMIPSFVNYHAMAIALQKSISYLYPDDCAVWYFDDFVEEHCGTEVDGVQIKRREDQWDQDGAYLEALKPYEELLANLDIEWMKKLPAQTMV